MRCACLSCHGEIAAMTILQGIRAAVKAGRLQQPFTAQDVAEALRGHHYSRGSFHGILARYSRHGPTQPNPPLRRVAPGQYRLAGRAYTPADPRRRAGGASSRSPQ